MSDFSPDDQAEFSLPLARDLAAIGRRQSLDGWDPKGWDPHFLAWAMVVGVPGLVDRVEELEERIAEVELDREGLQRVLTENERLRHNPDYVLSALVAAGVLAKRWLAPESPYADPEDEIEGVKWTLTDDPAGLFPPPADVWVLAEPEESEIGGVTS